MEECGVLPAASGLIPGARSVDWTTVQVKHRNIVQPTFF